MQNRWEGPRFRELLQQVMDSAGLTQKDVAAIAGVSQAMASRWLRADHRPGFDALQRLAAAVRERRPSLAPVVNDLLLAAGYGSAVPPDSEPAAAPAEVEPPDPVKLLLPPDEYAALGPYEREQARRYLERQARIYMETLRPPA